MSDDVLVVSSQGKLAELWSRTSWRAALYLAGCIVLGAFGGLVWSAITPLASYTIRDDLVAAISERGQAELVAADATFTLVTGIIGLLCGIVGWLLLHQKGWLVLLLPLIAAVASSSMAWRLGLIVGKNGFAERLAAAAAGDVVQIDLQLRSLSALLVGPFAAITPIMLLAAFWPEPRDELDAEVQAQAD